MMPKRHAVNLEIVQIMPSVGPVIEAMPLVKQHNQRCSRHSEYIHVESVHRVCAQGAKGAAPIVATPGFNAVHSGASLRLVSSTVTGPGSRSSSKPCGRCAHMP